jgi:hypothetical protein
LLDNPEMARVMGDAGHKRIKELYSLEIMVDKYDRLYEIINNRKNQNIGKLLEELSAGSRENHEKEARERERE